MSAVPSTDDLKRKLLFIPCESKEALHNWIKLYLGLDLPNCTVDPTSNSNPMDFLWELYSKAMDGFDPEYTQVLGYSARDAFKTTLAAILQVLSLFHLRRNVCHLAAIENQAARCVSYVKRHLQRPFLRDYLVSKNKRTIEVAWLENSDGDIRPPSDEVLVGYVEKRFSIQVLVATLSGVNSPHCSLVVLDELDLAPPGPVAEAKLIPAPGEERGELPITLMISSRKFAIGNVQKEIDKAADNGLVIRHWNSLDVCRRCPPSRHLPELPKIPIYRSDDTLKALSREEYDQLPFTEQEKYVQDEGHVGCLKNCKLYAVCRGALITKQTSDSKLLKPIDHLIGLFRSNDSEMIKSQLLCWKPSSAGLIYPNLNREVHCLSAQQIAERIGGRGSERVRTKTQLIDFLKTREVRFYGGFDWGYTHPFAAVLVVVDGQNAYVIDAVSVSGLELSQKIDIIEKQWASFKEDVQIFPDPESPSDIKTFKRYGWKMREWDKFKGSVLGGIESVRMMLMPVVGPPKMFFLGEDEGVEGLIKDMARYHWKLDVGGNPTDVPDDEGADSSDAIRYLVLNVFGPKARFIVSEDPKPDPEDKPKLTDSWFDRVLEQQGVTPTSSEDTPTGSTSGRKGKFIWSI